MYYGVMRNTYYVTRKALATAAVGAALVAGLTSCASDEFVGREDGSKASTSITACMDAVYAWQDFTAFASTPGRDDAQMVRMRSAMIVTWREVAEDAPTWMQGELGVAIDAMTEFSSSPSLTTDGRTSLYRDTANQLDRIRLQCVHDGNLDPAGARRGAE